MKPLMPRLHLCGGMSAPLLWFRSMQQGRVPMLQAPSVQQEPTPLRSPSIPFELAAIYLPLGRTPPLLEQSVMTMQLWCRTLSIRGLD